MSARDAFTAADHERARELAAARIDDVLPPTDEAWLADHLEACAGCATVDAEYATLHHRLAALRDTLPQPPRDLWARTSAAIEAERRRTSGAGRWRRLRASPRSSTRLALAPVVAMVAIVVVVGASLFNGRPTVPGGIAAATPIAIKGAADLQVLAFDSAGNLQLLSRRVDQVCPTGVADCGVSPTFAVTGVSAFGDAADLFGAMSPTGGQMVVIRRDPGSQAVYVVPVKPAPASNPPRSTTAFSTGSQAPSHAAATASSATASSTATASTPASPASASPASPSAGSASPDVSAGSASPVATDSAPPSPSDSSGSASPSNAAAPTPSSTAAAASPSDSASPEPASSSASPAPSVVPSLAVSPSPEAAIKIASGVTVVGAPTYSPDGTRLAFSAMPSDASSGPDIYIWQVGDRSAEAITSDHNSWLAGWTSSGILVSRVDNGMPTTFRLDAVTGRSVAIGAPGTWLPAVSPTGTAAAWWAGTVKLAADGVTWLPDQGRLVIGSWPSTTGGAAGWQVLSKGPLDAWQVRWDNTGAVVAAWIAQSGGRSGQLSLYGVDATGNADLANPMLDATPANPDFSLRAGRLAWTVPAQGAPQTVQVLAWSGKTVYPRMELPADGSGTVVP